MTRDDLLRIVRAAAAPDPGRILDALVDFSGAERGFLVLRRAGEFEVRTARNMGREETARARENLSRTLLGRALAEGRPVRASDADLSSIESLQGRKVRAVCVLPLRSSDGAVYLDHRSEKGAFAETDFLGEISTELDRSLRAALDRNAYGEIVGSSKPMQELFRLLDRTAAAPYPVLVTGESGTGKELVAREIHRRSPRAGGPFVAANCATLPEQLIDSELFGHSKGAFTGADRDHPGLFEQARGGVLFLDEIACLSADAQESFLRVLETGEVRRVGGTRTEQVDVRVVAATNEDLEVSGSFRKDLFYRLNVLRLDLPPLRERRDDIPVLVEGFLDRIARETGSPRKNLSKPGLSALLEYRWPGNVRELLNALRRAASLADGDSLQAADFAFLRERIPPSGDDPIHSIEDHIRTTLIRWSGRLEMQEIADRLGLSRKTLWEKKKKFGL